MNSLPEWKLPAGTSRQSWAYVADSKVAADYDCALAENPLFTRDLQVARSLFQPVGALIDLGCGTGRLLLPFAQSGSQVMGVDLSDEMLRLARQKAIAAGISVPLLRANLVELDCFHDRSFDHAACLFSTL